MRTEIKKVACIGSGVIGMSWALKFAWSGREVVVYDIGDVQIAKARDALEKSLDSLRAQDLANEEECEKIKGRISYTTDLAEALRDADFVQESGPENLEIKQQMIADMERYIGDDVVIASSSSGLLVTDMARKAAHPERIVLGHPVNPPHLIPVVEVVKGEQSSDEAIACTDQFYTAIGKEVVIVNREVPGYVLNRLISTLYREIISLVETGVCSIEDADKALHWGLGLRWALMGHSLVLHLGAGEDGNLRVMLERYRDQFGVWFKSLECRTEIPQTYLDRCMEGIEKEIANLPEEMGKTVPELIRYRDAMLVSMLRQQHKL